MFSSFQGFFTSSKILSNLINFNLVCFTIRYCKLNFFFKLVILRFQLEKICLELSSSSYFLLLYDIPLILLIQYFPSSTYLTPRIFFFSMFLTSWSHWLSLRERCFIDRTALSKHFTQYIPNFSRFAIITIEVLPIIGPQFLKITVAVTGRVFIEINLKNLTLF